MPQEYPPQEELQEEATEERTPKGESDLWRLLRYSLLRLGALFIAVVVGVYLMILIANMGGYVDEIRRAEIAFNVAQQVRGSPEFAELPEERRREIMDSMVETEEKRLGLHEPFYLRSIYYLRDALTLDLGRSENLTSDAGSRQVRHIILERLPPTLFLFLSAQIITFFAGLFIALALSRQYGSKLDKFMVALAPTSAAPSWFYGIFLILIFAALLGWLPFGRMVAAPPPDDTLMYAMSVIRHLILPVTAIVLGALFLTIYQWRTYFLIYSSEDYVEMARAKGLSGRQIERRYILRPTLPPIITSFLLGIITVWMGQIVLETVFTWPGLGRLLFQAIGLYDTPVIIGVIVIFAYLLAITVFLLDFIYAIVDPRVKVGGEGGQAA